MSLDEKPPEPRRCRRCGLRGRCVMVRSVSLADDGSIRSVEYMTPLECIAAHNRGIVR